MKIHEIEKEWSVDSFIDQEKLDTEAIRIPKLHSKYIAIYNREKYELYKIQASMKELEFILQSFYKKELSDEEIIEYGLGELPSRAITKDDRGYYVDTHPEMVKAKQRVGTQHDKIDMLKGIMSQLSNRSFQIANAIKFMRFQQGLDS